MNKLILVSVLIAAVCAVPLVQRNKVATEEELLFNNFKTQYGKVYFDQHDEEYRKQVFSTNLQQIREHNLAFAAGQTTYTLAMNEFGDLTFEEFHSKHTGFFGLRNRFVRSQNVAHTKVDESTLAASVDWTAKGAVTAVKDQGQCGSCWSFSATGSIEGAWFIAGHPLVSLSEQQLMDCSKSEGNMSCEGGLMDYAFEWVKENGGICSEASYPYQAVDRNSCDSCTNVASISSYTDVGQSDASLMAAINQQPVSVAIEADQTAFQFYNSGVLTGSCGTQLDHGVLAVGYGTLSGTDYYKVKNSWGGSWGMSGYVLIQRGKSQAGGQCGILLAASYPTI